MQDVIPFDFHRMFFGDAPILYLAEIGFRIVIIWIWTMVLLRWIGGRSISQLSLVEFLLVIALGSAVGDSLFLPEVPLLHAFLVILIVVLIDKSIDKLIGRYTAFKKVIDGEPLEVVNSGIILNKTINCQSISTTELIELLRLKGVENLGEVRRAYLEPSGQLSVFRFNLARPGLSLVPPVDEQTRYNVPFPDSCCANCGSTEIKSELGMTKCSGCQRSSWVLMALIDQGHKAESG